MAAGGNAPAIIKRKKVVAGGGHHGGAWKVAYADFVTAMMAFFLLMWLLNATTEQQLKGLADYFAPSVPISRTSGGSDGMFGGDSMSSEETLATDGSDAAGGLPGTAEAMEGEAEGVGAQAAEVAALEELERTLLARGGESMQSELALRHVITRLTDEGLVIEFFALPGAPLFAEDGAVPMPVTTELVAMVADSAQLVTNPVAVAAHLPAAPVVANRGPWWDLSMARADMTRILLEASGMEPLRLQRVAGHADRRPADPDNPGSVRNDRIEIIFLRQTG
jgi:chemotaxis protein MotB